MCILRSKIIMATGSYTAASPKNYLGEPWTYTFRIVHWQRGPTQSWHDLISAIWTGALMNTKNASMDYPVQLWQSHFKKCWKMGWHSKETSKMNFKFLSSSSSKSALVLIPAQACHVMGCATHKHNSSHKVSQLLFKPGSDILFYYLLWLWILHAEARYIHK